MTGAHGGAHGEFMGAAHGAGEKKIGDVGAGDQEKEADSREQHEQEGLNVADDVLLHGNEIDAHGFVGLGISGGEIFGNAVHIGLSLRETYVGLEAADTVSTHADAAIEKGRIDVLADGGVDVAILAVESEAGRNHADDLVGGAIEGHRFADNIERGTEFAAPQTAAEKRNGRSAGVIVTRKKSAAENGRYAQRGEKIRGNHVAGEALGDFAGTDEVVVLVAVNGQGGKCFCVALPVEEVGISERSLVEPGHFFIDGDELAGLRVGQRIEQHAVDYRKERSVGADAERERQNGDGGEGRRLGEQAECVTQVLEESVHAASLVQTDEVRQCMAEKYCASSAGRGGCLQK